jgi:transcriptional regulator with XRE-family HTH domain
MKTREELLKTQEYWFETLQNDIYRIVAEYLEKEKINQSQLAEKLGVSRGYISQIMNGNFNFTLKKLIELSLAVGRLPVLEFKHLKSQVAGKQAHNKYNNDLVIQKVAEKANAYKQKK